MDGDGKHEPRLRIVGRCRQLGAKALLGRLAPGRIARDRLHRLDHAHRQRPVLWQDVGRDAAATLPEDRIDQAFGERFECCRIPRSGAISDRDATRHQGARHPRPPQRQRRVDRAPRQRDEADRQHELRARFFDRVGLERDHGLWLGQRIKPRMKRLNEVPSELGERSGTRQPVHRANPQQVEGMSLAARRRLGDPGVSLTVMGSDVVG